MKLFKVVLLLVLCNTASSQNYIEVNDKRFYLGCKIDNDKFKNVLESQQVKTRGVQALAASYSLEKYLPTIGNQGATGTCAAWATAYYTLSILYNINNSDQKRRVDFSPFFLYNNLKYSTDSSCQDGMYIEDALNFLKYKGGLPNTYYEGLCKLTRDKQPDLWDKALNYRIKDYKRIGDDNRIQRIKRALSLKKGIVIAIKTPWSFASSLNGDTWDGIFDYNRGGHAVSLIAYDDNKEGGSFLIINSWGKEWGDNGRIWVKYSDFDKLVYQVFEITGYTDNELKRYSARNGFEGEIKIFDKKGKEVEHKSEDFHSLDVLLDSTEIIDDDYNELIDSTNQISQNRKLYKSSNVSDTSIIPELDFMMEDDDLSFKLVPEILEYDFEYKSNSEDCENGFKIKISNRDSGYIYLFSIDEYEKSVSPIAKNNNTQIFLGGKRSDIILPETDYIKGCSRKKFILLISKEMIDENSIEKYCTGRYNTATDFINYNFANDLVLNTPTKNDYNTRFSLKNDPGKILPVIINFHAR